MTAQPAPAAAPKKSGGAFNRETVLEVQHYTDRLFRFRTTRDSAFRFINGQFAMIGLEVEGKPLLRAYSMASANYEDDLEFFSIKVPDGPLTSRLQHLKVGDTVLIGRKPTGTLVQSSLLPGKRLYMFSTGTGIAPFSSIIKDPEVYDLYDNLILVHGCREVAELQYGFDIVKAAQDNEFFGEIVREKLIHYPTVTREPFQYQGRATDLIENGKLFDDIGQPPLDPAEDRVMICGSPGLLRDLVKMLQDRGFREGSSGDPATFVIEKAFVEQ
ncbi:ferredoxin--NADP reductase [Rhodoblastus sp.]|uniref:ferredoxin--NADP reductase n=1 Tax=Rhodoblastus sp. TaxID=1962975 RepID=UPI002627CF6E|nr:ferredoxin--NADP reductase [Rhodoblastus sp.]